jgi:hypothetical protein
VDALYECRRCGVVSRFGEDLCSPRKRQGKEAYCGTAPERGNMCDEMRERLPFVCGICGRPAREGELVCKPWITG